MTTKGVKNESNNKILGVKRLPNTKNGNPKYRIITEHGSARILPNSSLSYRYNFRSMVGETVEVEYSSKWNKSYIVDMERIYK